MGAKLHHEKLTLTERKVVDALAIANEALADFRFATDGTIQEISREQKRAEAEGVSNDTKNELRKQEPAINKALLASVILAGTPDAGDASLRMAVLLESAVGKGLSKSDRTIDRAYLQEQFGPELGQKVMTDIEELHKSMAALSAGNSDGVSERYAQATAALAVAGLRMAVRSVGDGTLPDKMPGAQFMTEHSEDFQKAIELADAAVKRVGANAAGFKNASILFEDAIRVTHEDLFAGELTNSKDTTIPRYQNSLPAVMPYQTGTYNPNEAPLDKVMRAAFEVSRYEVHNRRKDGNPNAVHEIRVASYDATLDPDKFAADVLHDNAEDRYWDKEKSLQIFHRFGPVVAGRVAEATDVQPSPDQITKIQKAIKNLAAAHGADERKVAANAVADVERAVDNQLKQQSKLQYAQKAELFKILPFKTSAELFSGRGPEVTEPANPKIPFSIEGALLKISDFRQTMEATLQDPDMVTGRSASSGFQLGLARNKGIFIQPLVEALTTRQDEVADKGFDMAAISQQLQDYARVSEKYLLQAAEKVAQERGIDGKKLAKLLTVPAKTDVLKNEAEFKDSLKNLGLRDEIKPDHKGRPTAVAVVRPGFDASLAINIDNLFLNYQLSCKLGAAVDNICSPPPPASKFVEIDNTVSTTPFNSWFYKPDSTPEKAAATAAISKLKNALNHKPCK